ncbi:MAG TPA: cyclopropane fatty acyl phospholipid synthase [Candidatus Paceibacterota bacterium]|nr:cyclopropane fatty acyl phospholipid synthase [Candidatus Paceibacterota bacterium]
MASARAIAEKLLAKADIRIGGDRPWDIAVHDERFFGRALSEGSLGLGESYMDGWWDVPELDEFIRRVLAARLDAAVAAGPPPFLLTLAKAFLFNLQSRSRAFQVGEKHYDLGNDLYEAMLDKRLTYTCGYWKDARNLDEAQEAKLDLVCRKIGLKKGDRVLDIGCGWGSFAIFAAERYGVSVTGVTVSKEQAELGQARAKGLPIEIRLQDYREVTGTFTHVVSIGIMEHVGAKNYATYFDVVRRCLADGGLSLLHTIGSNVSVRTVNPWIGKYIFPNGMLPSVAQLGKAMERRFVMEDWHNFGADYDATLMAWFRNFDAAWPALRGTYGDRFYRMWKYYLLTCAGAFRARDMQLWQVVLSPHGVPGGYRSVR